jgi:hypothetical protein
VNLATTQLAAIQLCYCQDCGQLRSQTGQGHRCYRRARRTSTSTPAPGSREGLDQCARPSGSRSHHNPTTASDLRVLRPLTSGVPSSAAANLQQLAPTTATQTNPPISAFPPSPTDDHSSLPTHRRTSPPPPNCRHRCQSEPTRPYRPGPSMAPTPSRHVHRHCRSALCPKRP